MKSVINSPLYIELSIEIKKRIENGEYRGTLPSEAKLGEIFKASRTTIRKAIDLLVDEGVVLRKKGSGTYIQNFKIEKNMYEVQSFKDEMRKRDIIHENKVVNFEVVDATSNIASKLNIQKGDKVYYIKRLTLIKKKPITLEYSYMPLYLFEDLSYTDLVNSKYEYVESKKGYKISGSKQEIMPVSLSSSESKLLKGREGEASIKVSSVASLVDGTPFDYSEMIYKAGTYKLTIYKKRT